MSKTIPQLHTEAQQIENATVTGENTATRVGGCIDDIVEYIEDNPPVFATTEAIGSMSIFNSESELTGKTDAQKRAMIPSGKVIGMGFNFANPTETNLTSTMTWVAAHNIWAAEGGSGDTALGALHPTTSGQLASDFLDISQYEKIRVTMPSTPNNVDVGLAFYSAQDQDTVISAERVPFEGESGWSYVTKTYDVPVGANYIRCTRLSANDAFTLIGIDIDSNTLVYGYGNAIDELIDKSKKSEGFINVKALGAVGDGVTDDTDALQDALDMGGIIYIPKGVYVVRHTLVLNSDTILIGDGFSESEIRAENGASLSTIAWRGTAGAATMHSTLYPVIVTKQNSTGIQMKGVGVYDAGAYTSGLGKTRVGILPYYTDGMSIVDCGANHINWLDPNDGTMAFSAECAGFGLYVFNSTNVRVNGGHYEYGGYESVGTENSHNVYFDNAYIGSGWRCAFQVHKDCYNVHLTDCTVRQDIYLSNTNQFTSSAVILDGRSVNGLHDVFIDNNHIYGNVTTYQGGGGVKCVLGNEYNIYVRGNWIVTNFRGVADQEESAGGFSNPKNWIITDNMITAPYGVYHRRVKGIIVKNNIIDSSTAAITISSAAYIVHDNVLLDNQTISLSGTDVSN